MENATREFTSSTVAIHGSTSIFCGRCNFQTDEIKNIDKLRELRNKNITTPIDFFVGGVSWTETIADDIIQTFQFYSSRRWNEGRFHISSAVQTFAHFRRVLETAVQNRLFRRLRFCATHNCASSDLDPACANFLADVLRNGRDLERVTLQDFEISNTAASILAKGLIHDGQASNNDVLVGPRELVFDGNRFAIEQVEGHSAVHLASGLKRNTTLRLLAFRGSYLYDSTLALLVQSLIGHPTLKALHVTFSDFGPETISSLQRLLSSPYCQLQELELSNLVSLSDTPTRLFDIQNFIFRMPINHSLRSLSLMKQELTDFDVNLLLQNLFKFPELRTLNLQLNRIRDLATVTKNFTASSTQPPTFPPNNKRLRSLNLDYNDCFAINRRTTTKLDDDRTRTAILRLLAVFPQLGDLGNDFLQAVEDSTSRSKGGADGMLVPFSVQHRMDMNRCGEHLLRAESTLPLSAWPFVLAKVNNTWKNNNSLSRQANVQYHLLREGPAFGAREALS